MDEIIPGLWVGDLPSALDTPTLKAHKIFSIVSAMRGRVTISETFIKHQIQLDDTEDEDILVHFIPSITFIQTELDKGRGVLVHCQAGMSRSVTIVAAYLMYTQKLDPNQALDIIREHRPNICPNAGFLVQLEIFHQASFKISRSNKTTRMFYLERTVEEIMNGDGSLPETDMFAKFPRTPTDSTPNTPGGPRRRIRCKMCRQELATREHMLDHGQLNPPTPAVLSPAVSRRPSSSVHNPVRRPSVGQPSRLGMSDSLAMSSTVEETNTDAPTTSRKLSTGAPQPPRRSSSTSDPRKAFKPFPHLNRGMLDSLSMSALDTEDDEDEEVVSPKLATEGKSIVSGNGGVTSVEAAQVLGRRMSDAVIASNEHTPGPEKTAAPATLISPAEFVAQLRENSKLAALRSSEPGTVSMTPKPISLPIIANPKCSGYFLEPMKWMEPFLESGQLAGKIQCPNKKCKAKLGNYDWAGVLCSCKQWVTPGFCVHRSKVDEIVGP